MIVRGIVGTGPSLAGVNLERFPADRVLALKEMMFDIPGATGFAADVGWMTRRRDAIEARGNVTLAVPLDGSKKYPLINGARYVERRQGVGLSEVPDVVNMGGSTGHAALNLVFHDLPRLIVLFGYDYGRTPDSHHYKTDRYQTVVIGYSMLEEWADNFVPVQPQLLAAGIDVIVAGPSRLRGFKNVSIDEGIEMLCESGSVPQR